MPLTGKGNEIMSAMQKEYGAKKGESVFYASKNKGRISGVDSAMFPGEKAGEPYDPKKEAENRKQAAKERARNMEEAGRSRRKDSTTPNPGDPNLLALSDAARAMRDAAELLTKRCDAMEREDASAAELSELRAEGKATGYPDGISTDPKDYKYKVNTSMTPASSKAAGLSGYGRNLKEARGLVKKFEGMMPGHEGSWSVKSNFDYKGK